MTQSERRKVPPLVPKKKKSLCALRNDTASPAATTASTVDSNTIVLPHLRAREEEEPLAEPSLERLVESISLDANYVASKPRRNEPKAITLESIMKPTVRTDIRIGGRFRMKSVETPLERRFDKAAEEAAGKASSPPPPVKPKPKLYATPTTTYAPHKEKPALKPKPSLLAKTTSTSSTPVDNTPAFLREAMQKRLQLSQGIPLPGLAKLPPRTLSETSSFPAPSASVSNSYRLARTPAFLSSPQKSHTIDNGSLEKRGKPLVHPNKRRAKGPKRRLPTELSSSSSATSSASSVSSISSSSTSSLQTPLRHRHKTPPPIRKPSKAIAVHS